MSKKIKKNSNGKPQRTVKQMPNGLSEKLDSDFVVEFDEKTGEVVFVVSFRLAWGDPLDGDFDYVLSLDEAYELASCIVSFYENMKNSKREENSG